MDATVERLTIDVVSDVVCPWCFLGKRRLDAAIRASEGAPIAVRWRPFMLDPSIPAGGMDRRAHIMAKFKDDTRLAVVHDRLTEMGKKVGIAYAFDRIERAPNTLDAHRLIRWASRRRQASAVVDRLFRALLRRRPRRRRSQAADRGRARMRHGRRTPRETSPKATTSIWFRRRSLRPKRSASPACRSSSSLRASGFPARRTPRCSPRRSRRRARLRPASKSPDPLSRRFGERGEHIGGQLHRRRGARLAFAFAERQLDRRGQRDSNGAAASTGGASNSSSAAATASISSGA